MAQEIRKKVIDQDLSSSDEFDEKMLEQIEKEFDQMTFTGGNTKSGADTSSFDFFASEAPKTTFSLDDFETSIDKGNDLISQEQPKPSPAPAEPLPQTPPPAKPRFKALGTMAQKKIIIFGAVAALLILIAGIKLVGFLRQPPPQTPQITRVVRHPIAVQLYQEQFNFLILANAQREKDLISLGIEFQFPSTNAFEDFQKENVIFRDVIYQFLQGERPVKNSPKYWQQIVENSLPNYLKAIFPNSGLSSIRMVYLDRL